VRKLSPVLAALIAVGLLVAAGLSVSAEDDMPPGMEVADPADFVGSAGMVCTRQKVDGAVTSRACWDAGMQRMWVKDDARDGYSGVASWSIPAFAVSGYCQNKLEAGNWGYCQYAFRDFVENGQILFGAGVYNGDGRDQWPARLAGWAAANVS
jgi:hypothetical protein